VFGISHILKSTRIRCFVTYLWYNTVHYTHYMISFVKKAMIINTELKTIK